MLADDLELFTCNGNDPFLERGERHDAAYAVWVGIGATGTALLGILLFGESAGVLKLASLALIVAGIAGLKLSG